MRAEEIIMEVYKQKLERQKAGLRCQNVVMNMDHYRCIQEYHRNLGSLQGDLPDYINQDSLFGLEILIDNRRQTVVS